MLEIIAPGTRMTALTIGLSTLLLAGPSIAIGQQSSKKSLPNIVIIVADDLGYNDVSFHGGDIPTPAIDRIAHEGVALDRFYACPVCSPTRAGLLTGRWPIRMGIMRTVIPPWRKWGLPSEERTLAELLAGAGYERRMIVGKWHLGHSSPAYLPLTHGFTSFYGHYNGAIDYFTHEREGEIDWHRGRETIREEGYSTDLLGTAAVEFITKSSTEQPFFLYLPFNAPHSPFQAKDDDLAKFAELMPRRRRVYAAMVAAMDRAIGRVLDAIDRQKIADNTFVLFCSDNGGVRNVADNGKFRGGKISLYEGGIRVAAAARWPAGQITGGKKIEQPIGYIDVYPTIWRIVGSQADESALPLDGINALEIMRGEAGVPERDWFSYLAMGEPEEHIGVNSGRYKLIVHGPSILDENSAEKQRLELFDLENDVREQHNLADEKPEIVKQLMPKLKQFRSLKINGVTAYGDGREGFVAPKDWIVE